MKHVYKLNILNLRYSIVVFSKTNITINNYVFRIFFASLDSNSLHISFRRIQYSIRLIFNITINKSQDQFL